MLFEKKLSKIVGLITRKNIIRVFLLTWILFSVGYILLDQAARFKNAVYTTGYTDGYTSGMTLCVNQVIAEAQKTSCNAFPVHNATEQVLLVNEQCLSGAPSNEAVSSSDAVIQ